MSDFWSIDIIPEGHMSKSLEELLLGVENQAAASEAVRCAVERAAAADLPPAYQTNVPDYGVAGERYGKIPAAPHQP